MKIEQGSTPAFRPVTIVLETCEEVAVVASALARSAPAFEAERAFKAYGVKVPHDQQIGYRLYDTLDDIAKGLPCPPR